MVITVAVHTEAVPTASSPQTQTESRYVVSPYYTILRRTERRLTGLRSMVSLCKNNTIEEVKLSLAFVLSLSFEKLATPLFSVVAMLTALCLYK